MGKNINRLSKIARNREVEAFRIETYSASTKLVRKTDKDMRVLNEVANSCTRPEHKKVEKIRHVNLKARNQAGKRAGELQ